MKLLSPDEPTVLKVWGVWLNREICGVVTEDGDYQLPAMLYGWVEMVIAMAQYDDNYWPDIVAFGPRDEPWAEFTLGRTLEEVLAGKPSSEEV
jgi:hypothetical protein